MSNYNTIRGALGAAVQSFQPELNIYYFVPRTLVPPAAIVQPRPQRTVSYLTAQTSRAAEWYFNIMVVVGQIDEQAAQERTGDLISPGSPLLQALNGKVGNGYAQVVDGSISEMTFGTALYTYARLSVTVVA